MTNLKDINFGVNQYCGPAVLSALTGESTDRCAAVISIVSGKKQIKAVEKTYLRRALNLLKFDVEEIHAASSTLYGTLYKLRDKPGLYVIFVPHHVVAVEIKSDNEMYICDNHSKQPLDAKQSARLMQRCEGGWKVTRKAEPKFIKEETKFNYTSNTIDVVREYIYDQPEYNRSESVCHINYRNGEELRNLLHDLLHHTHEE